VTRATKLTAQLLAFARRQALQPEVFDVRQNIEMVSEMIGSLTGVRIRRDIRLPEHDCFVYADPSQFDTAIVNLAVNARDAMDGSGTLTISVECVSGIPPDRAGAAVAVAGQFVAVCVADTGVGIPAQHLAQIFEPFFTTKAQGRGTGLGLSTVQSIVRNTGGRIEVESEPGRGTTFRVRIPSTEDAVEPTRVPDDRLPVVGAGETVLLVDDDDGVRRMVRRLLERGGYRVLSATGPGEAILLAEQHADRIDLLLTDVVMPLLRGPALARRIRETIPGVRTLFMSGHPTFGEHGSEPPIRAIHKSVSSAVLLEAVRAKLAAEDDEHRPS
jgi:CheY-like chemotaxis protein